MIEFGVGLFEWPAKRSVSAGTMRADMSDLIGRVLGGRYRVVRSIGSGGMGAVFEAEQIGLERRVALKVLLDTDPRALMRLRQEALAAGNLRTPHVIAVFDFFAGTPGPHGEPAFVVMELLEGESLSAVLRREKKLAPARAARIASHVLAGLDAAHEANIVHRDIKPSNIWVTRSPAEEVIKLLDFGIVKTLGRSEGRGPHTTTGSVMGTPSYLTPEQLRGEPVDARSDLHAVGVVLHEMLAGRKPWSVDGPSLFAEILDHVPAPLAGTTPGITPALSDVVVRALAKNPAARFASAADMIAALQRAMTPSVMAIGPAVVGPTSAMPSTARRTMPMSVVPPSPRAVPPTMISSSHRPPSFVTAAASVPPTNPTNPTRPSQGSASSSSAPTGPFTSPTPLGAQISAPAPRPGPPSPLAVPSSTSASPSSGLGLALVTGGLVVLVGALGAVAFVIHRRRAEVTPDASSTTAGIRLDPSATPTASAAGRMLTPAAPSASSSLLPVARSSEPLPIRPTDAPATPTAPTSVAPIAPVAPSASARPSSSPPLAAKCECLANVNQAYPTRLCTHPPPARCTCDQEGKSICPSPWSAQDTCTSSLYPNAGKKDGDACSGWIQAGTPGKSVPGTGKLWCDYCYGRDEAIQFAGREGASCHGISREGRVLDGVVRCGP